MLADLAARVREAFSPRPVAAVDLVAEATRRRVVDAAVDLAVGDINDPAAFARLVEAVALHAGPTRRPMTTATPAVVPFGPKKGRPLADLSVNELERLEQWLTGAIHNQQRAQFRAANLSLRAGLRAELNRRTQERRDA